MPVAARDDDGLFAEHFARIGYGPVSKLLTAFRVVGMLPSQRGIGSYDGLDPPALVPQAATASTAFAATTEATATPAAQRRRRRR